MRLETTLPPRECVFLWGIFLGDCVVPDVLRWVKDILEDGKLKQFVGFGNEGRDGQERTPFSSYVVNKARSWSLHPIHGIELYGLRLQNKWEKTD